MKLNELATRLGVPVRTLRYVIEQNVISSCKSVSSGAGHDREVTDDQAVAIGLAARLHQEGVRGTLLRTLLKGWKSELKKRQRSLCWGPTTKDDLIGLEILVNAARIYEAIDG